MPNSTFIKWAFLFFSFLLRGNERAKKRQVASLTLSLTYTHTHCRSSNTRAQSFLFSNFLFFYFFSKAYNTVRKTRGRDSAPQRILMSAK